jgi:hypothetical protein
MARIFSICFISIYFCFCFCFWFKRVLDRGQEPKRVKIDCTLSADYNNNNNNWSYYIIIYYIIIIKLLVINYGPVKTRNATPFSICFVNTKINERLQTLYFCSDRLILS